MEISNKIIKKLNELYVLKRSKFLIMNKDGNYFTLEKQNKDDKRNQIADWRISEHLNGNTTLGVFAGSIFTKFICFDVDIKDIELAKWAVYKLINTITQTGISEEYIYTSFSGSKGYHVEIFFDEPIYLSDAEKFYLMILNNAELLNIKYGQIEFRPNDNQGVKIPLGIHFKTNKRCWYCDYKNQLKQIESMNYVLSVKQLDRQYFYDILNVDELEITEKQAKEFEEMKSKVNPLKIYEENIDEEATIESIEQLLLSGLNRKGTRHNSLVKIARYCKYNNLNSNDAKETLIKWMEWQDKKLYDTQWKDVLKDIDKICDNKYYDKYTLTIKNADIQIAKREIEEILKVDGKNEKLLLYCMLIHQKRYANKKGLFYMTYDQMSIATGLSRRTAIRLIKKLEDLDIIDVSRDDDTPTYDYTTNRPKSLPNIYKNNLLSDKSYNNDDVITFKVCDKNCLGCFNACLCNIYTNQELQTMFPRRQYENVIQFRDYCTA